MNPNYHKFVGKMVAHTIYEYHQPEYRVRGITLGGDLIVQYTSKSSLKTLPAGEVEIIEDNETDAGKRK